MDKEKIEKIEETRRTSIRCLNESQPLRHKFGDKYKDLMKSVVFDIPELIAKIRQLQIELYRMELAADVEADEANRLRKQEKEVREIIEQAVGAFQNIQIMLGPAPHKCPNNDCEGCKCEMDHAFREAEAGEKELTKWLEG